MSAVIVKLIPMGQAPNRLREWRLRRGMSQEELAGLAGCSKMQISGLERGRPRLDVLWMERLAAPLGIAPGDLLLPSANPNAARSPEEAHLLALYRATPGALQAQVVQVAEAIAGYDAGANIDKDRAA